MTGLRVHHLNCAHLTTAKLGGQYLACHVLLVETPSDGLVLIDTGLGTADYADMPSRLGFGFAKVFCRPENDGSLAAIRQVEALGFDPTDVRHVVQTHLDLDHVGGLSDFPWAAVHVHAAELAAAMARKGVKAKGRYRPKMWAHQPRFQRYPTAGERWFGFETVRDLRGLPEDLLMVSLPGHTKGHCGVAVNSTDGWLLHAGDAYFDQREVSGTRRRVNPSLLVFEAIVTTDRPQRIASQDALRQLVGAHPEVSVFCAHDPTTLPLTRRDADVLRP